MGDQAGGYRSIEGMTDYVATLPSGEPFPVLSLYEVEWVAHRTGRYLEELKFNTVFDLTALDRVVSLELLCTRWTAWLSAGEDYEGNDALPNDYRRMVVDAQKELRETQKLLGIDKPTRDKERGEGSLSAYIDALRRRAGRFNVLRSSQLARALTLVKDLETQVIEYDNMTEEERGIFKVSPETILQWCREHLFPEYDEIDAHFREHEQQMWQTEPEGPN